MKLLKVGRSSSCDIVIPSENVSSLHAEITVLDNGEILISDKNSVNGTFVGEKRLTPNTEVPVRRGDYVLFADAELPWARVPQPENLSSYKCVVNIGTNFRNDIQLSSEFGSRFHAVMKVDSKGKTFIKDLDSKNGVKVNGLKIKPGKDTPIKSGDIIICADQDITEDLKPYIPKNNLPKIIGIVAACLVAVAVLGGSVWTITNLGGCPYGHEQCKKLSQPSDMKSGTLYLLTRYFYVVTVENNPLPTDAWDGVVKFDQEKNLRSCSGTGFFIDDKGTIATNRHVACPWLYRESEETKSIQTIYRMWLDENLNGITHVNNEAQYATLCSSELGKLLDLQTKTIKELNVKLDILVNSPINISAFAYTRYVAYPGRGYTHFDEMERCDFVAESGTPDKDVALLQLNTQKTTPGCAIFNVDRFRTDAVKPLAEEFYSIGYPKGLLLGLDNQTRKLEPGIQGVKCQKEPSRFDFELSGMAVGGQSGSPIFDQFGHLVGILSQSYNEAGILKAVQARYLKQLYEENQ